MLHEPVEFELSDHQRIFADLIEETLAADSRVTYHRVDNPRRLGRGANRPFAIFDIETDPRHDLAVSIELADEAFTVRINGVGYTRRLGAATRYDWWVERRCRDVERMLEGRLRLVSERVLLLTASSSLLAGRAGRWRKLGSVEYAFIRVLPYLAPYGLLPVYQSTREYRNWYLGAEEVGGIDNGEADPADSP